MKRPTHIRSLICASLLMLSTAAAADLTGRVVSVADGDTLTILDAGRQQHRIRLADIDAPERRQAYSNRSKQRLAELCHGQDARVRVRDTDRYGRVVGTVICNGTDANADLVREGLAWVYVRYAPTGSPLYKLEADARAQRRGLWADPDPVAPWDWRRRSR